MRPSSALAAIFSLALGALVAGCSASPQAAAAPQCEAAPTTAPTDLRCTGLYAPDGVTLGADVRPYAPGLVLWSDGADKARFLYLPPGATIDTSDMDEWVFPAGTKVWKEFSKAGKRIETRLLWKQSASQWVVATYRWSDDGATATRLDRGVLDAGGGYEIPEPTKCDDCHRGRRDKLLGVEAIALAQPEATGVTLATLQAEGRLTKAPPASLVLPEDATGKARAALGYMHMNCGVSCHNRTGDAFGDSTGLFLRLGAAQLAASAAVTSLDAYKTTVNVPIASNVYYKYPPQGFTRIKPGDSAHSLVPYSAALRGSDEQMPPLATHVADADGVARIRDWVDALPH